MQPPLKPISLLLHTVPDSIHSELFSRLFNHLLKGQSISDQLEDLEGKKLVIRIHDSKSELAFQIRDRKLHSTSSNDWNVRISGKLEHFWLLASRAEDPDTFFFNRTLALEGETEAGLYLKNMLDSMEFDSRAHFDAVFGPRIGGILEKVASRASQLPLPKLG